MEINTTPVAAMTIDELSDEQASLRLHLIGDAKQPLTGPLEGELTEGWDTPARRRYAAVSDALDKRKAGRS